MANNNDIEIKVKVDVSEVNKSFKDIEKSSDKMAKNVVKDTDKINKAQDQLERQLKDTSKSMKDIFKNINVTGVTKAMNDVQRSVSKTVANVKQQLQDALNIKANVDINTKTTNKSDGANQGTNMTSSLMGSAMSGGAIGSKIAKELSQNMSKGLSQVQSTFNTTLKDMKSEAETLSMVFDGIDDNLIEQMNRIKAQVLPIMDEINANMVAELGEDVITDALDMTTLSDNVRVAKSEIKGLIDELRPLKDGLSFTDEAKGFRMLNAEIRDTVDRVDNLTWNLTDAGDELLKFTRPRGNEIKLNADNVEVAMQLLEKLDNEIDSLETKINQSNFFDNLDVTPIINSLEKFQQAQTKANVQPLINELRKLNEEAKAVGVSVRGVDEVLRQYAQIEANSSQLTKEFGNNLIGVCQQFKAYNAQVQINAQAQAVMKQRQAEINSQTTTLGQTLVKAKHHLQDFGTALKQAFSSGMQKAGQYIDNLRNKSQQMANAHKQAANKIKSANTGIMASFKSLLTSMIPFLTLYGAFNLIKTSVTEAMGAIESNNMYMAVFGDKASEMDKWIKSVNQSMGLGVNNTKQYTAIIQQMGSAMGLTSDEAMNMSQKMAVMAGDISSFYNVDLAQAQDDLRSALSGSNEVLTKYGIVVRENTISSFAYANGIATVGSELTSAQRAMALTMMVEQQLGQANGALAKELDSPTGRARRLSTAMYDLRVALGNVVMPIWNAVMPGLIALANALTAVFNKIASVVNGILSLFGLGLKGGSSGGSSGGGFLGDVADSVGGIGSSLGDGLDKASGGSGKVADDLKDSAKSAKEIAKSLSLMGIDEINNLSSPSNSGGGSGSGGSGGSGSGGSGGSGGGVGGGLAGAVDDAYKVVEEGESIFDEMSEQAQKFVDAFKEVWSAIATGFAPYKQNILDQWNLLKLNIQALGQEIVNFLSSCWENGGRDIAVHLGVLAAAITETFLGITNTVVESVTKLFQHLNPDSNQNVKRFISAFDSMIQAVTRFVRKCDDWFQVFMDNGGQEFLNNMADVCFILATTFVEAITDAINSLTDFLSEDDNKRVKNFAENLADVSEQLKGIAQWIQDNIGWITILGGLLSGIWIGMKLAPAVIGAVTLAMQGWGWIVGIVQGIGGILSWLWTTILLPLWNTVLVPIGHAIMVGLGAIASFFGISVGAVIAIIAGLIATGVLLWKNWDWICEKASEITTNVKKWFGEMWSKLCTWLQDISKNSKQKWEEAKQAAINKCKEMYNNVVSWFKNLFSSIKEKCSQIFATIKEKWEQIKQKVVDKCKEMWSKVTEWFGKIKDNVVTWCSDLWQSIQDGWNTIVEGITGFCTEIWDNITGWFKDIVGLFTGGWKDSDKETEKGFDNIEETAKNGADKTKTGIMSKLKGVLPDLGTLWSNVKSGASDKWSSIKETVTTWSTKAKDGIKNSLSGVTGNLSTIWSNVKNGASTAWSNIKGGVSDWATKTKNGVQSSLSGAVGNVATIWSNIKNGVSGAWSNVKNAVSGSVSAVKNQVQSSLSGAISNVSNIWSSISRGVSGAWNGIRSQVQSAVNKVKSVMNFSWSLPKPKLPHFKVSGGKAPWGFGGQGKLPSISVQFYKNGGIMTKPTFFGMNGNSAMIGGEAGKEGIIPLDSLWNQLDKQFARQNAMLANKQQQPINVELTVDLDGKKVAKNTYRNIREMQRLGQIQF